MRLHCLCFLIFCVALYTFIMVTYLQSYIKKNKKTVNLLPPKLIVLVSQPRSGSTFLGNVISKSIQSVYFYEPLYRYDASFKIDINFANRKQRTNYDSMSAEYLRKVFACDFNDQQSWHRIFESPFKVLSSNECQEENTLNNIPPQNEQGGTAGGYKLNRCLPYFNSNQIQKNCQRMNLMVKLLELRIPLSEVKQLQNLLDYRARYRILYLVRDPRAAFLSLLKTGWVAQNKSGPEFRQYVEKRCDEMERNIRDVKELKNVITVRYEDIIVKSTKTFRKLYDFLGEEDTKKIQTSMNSQPCYVPKFNNKNNISSHFNSRKLLYKLVKVPDDQEKINSDLHRPDDDDERHYIRKTEIDRQNYRCYALNKWRYEVSSEFIELVESKCGKMMDLVGYLRSNGDGKILQDVSRKLIKPEY